MPYPKCKVYSDGNHYIAIPHTTRPYRPRRKPKEEIIPVTEVFTDKIKKETEEQYKAELSAPSYEDAPMPRIIHRRCIHMIMAFQSTHPMRGATFSVPTPPTGDRISIHAPHAGCDLEQAEAWTRQAISIHAPHAGYDIIFIRVLLKDFYFNPRTPCGVRLDSAPHKVYCVQISIHAPHAGCDLRARCSSPIRSAFQFTHPMRGATLQFVNFASKFA